MGHAVIVATSPLNCAWIVPGSRRSIDGLEYGVCRRTADAERVVNEAECLYCPAWTSREPEPPSERTTPVT